MRRPSSPQAGRWAAAAMIAGLLYSTPVAAQLPGGRRVAVVFAVTGELSTATFDEVRRALDGPVAEAGYQPTAANDYVDLLPAADDPETLRCLDEQACLMQLRNQVGVPILLLVELSESGGQVGIAVKAWTSGAESGTARAKPKPLASLTQVVSKASKLALGSLDKKLAKRAGDAARDMGAPTPTVKPIDKKPQPTTTATAETTAETTTAAETTAAEAPATETPKARYKFKPVAPEKPGFAVELGAWGGIVPLRFNRTTLLVGERVAKQPLGDIGVGVSLAFRMPGKLVDDLYQTNRFTYVLASPLGAWHLSVGGEKRLKGDLLAPFVGAAFFLTSVTLPVLKPNADGTPPTSDVNGGETRASAMAVGGQGYGGLAVYLHKRVAVHLRVGYRYSTRDFNQFGEGDTTYFAHDAKGRVWKVSVSGPFADLGVTFEI